MLEFRDGSVIETFYSLARSKSIIRGQNGIDSLSEAVELEHYTNDIEHELSFALSEFPRITKEAAQKAAPHIVVVYLQKLSKLHGKFYTESKVKDEPNIQVRLLRTQLHEAYVVVTENALHLLNIPTVDIL
jgi:arginyl-tRNA synthetase